MPGTCPYQYPATTKLSLAIILIKHLNKCICNHCCCNLTCIFEVQLVILMESFRHINGGFWPLPWLVLAGQAGQAGRPAKASYFQLKPANQLRLVLAVSFSYLWNGNMDNIFVNIILFSLISVNVIKLASLASSSTESTNMAEDVKCGETDKPIQLSESFYAGTDPTYSNSWLWSLSSSDSLAKKNRSKEPFIFEFRHVL